VALIDQKNNIFSNFKKEINEFFNLDNKKIQSIIELYNSKGYDVSLTQFSEITNFELDGSEAEYRRYVLGAIIDELRTSKNIQHLIEHSGLSKNVKEKIHVFLKKLNDNGKNGLYLQHHASGRSLLDPMISELEEDVFFREIRDNDNKPVCFIPVFRIKFVFDKEDKQSTEYAYFTPERLSIFLAALQKTYEQNITKTQRYKKGMKTDLPVIG
jgi:hypothetical protein